MRPGDVVAERFVIERLAGTGGMGAVWRAADRTSGDRVALKILHPTLDDDHERFAREARVLAELCHPAIVRYVAHGVEASGTAWLAMEWLEGEDLARCLEAGGLPRGDAALICQRAAEALAVAHARGILHRDIKPSNVFLVGGEPTKTKLLDFGIARREVRSQVVTRTGGLLGTIGYMAPEIAAGVSDLDARSDVFALGCVLFECLTGTPAFAGGTPLAVMGRVLSGNVPRVREIAPDVPRALDALVARMLAKDRAERPRDGAAVVDELAALPDLCATVPPPAPRPPQALTGREHRLVSVLLAEIEPGEPMGRTLSAGELERVLQPARALLQRMGGEVSAAQGGALLMTFSRRGSATDIACQAASSALRLLEMYPNARIAVATARAERTGARPTGPLVETVSALLAKPGPPGVRVDEVTAGLLDPRFEVEGDGPVRVLLRAEADAVDTRRLLGRVTPCVGRDKELGLLTATFEECLAEPVARAVLITAPAGGGKSRLRRELLRRTRALERATVLSARGDPLSAGSALDLVRQLVHQAAGIAGADRAPRQHHRIADYARRLFEGAGKSAPEVQRLSEFLGELAGSPPPEPGPELRAARGEPRALAEWLRRAFEATLTAECALRPVLVVLEDLHWGDQPSLAFLAESARHSADKPLMILALARPEVRETFPRLSLGPELLDLQLPGLTRRAAEALVVAVLGADAPADTVQRIVERADGNAFYLEELIRRVAEHGDDALPETILAMVEARLEALPAEARRVLRAASVYGLRFGTSDVEALVGDGTDVAGWLPTLVHQELIEQTSVARPPTTDSRRSPASLRASADRFAFRHALVREAAYATLTAHDRAVGHGLAAAALEARGEPDPLALAEHWTRAGEERRALPWLARAAQSALESSNLEAAYALAERGVAAGASAEMLAHLRVVQAQVRAWEARWEDAASLAEQARALAPLGGTEWFRAAVVALFAAMSINRPAIDVLAAIQAMPADTEPSGSYARALSLLATGMVFAGQKDIALALLQRLDAVDATTVDPAFTGWRELARASASLLVRGDLGGALRHAALALQLLDDAGDPVGQALATIALARAQVESGRFADAERNLDRAEFLAERQGAAYLRDWARVLMAIAHNRSGRWQRGMELARPASASGGTLTRFVARIALANSILASGDSDQAEREARASLEEGGWMPIASAGARSLLARIEMLRGRPAAAIAEAEEGLKVAARAGEPLLEGSTLHLVRAEALHALGDPRAVDAIKEAHARIERIAQGIDDPELRRAYTEDLEINGRTLELARVWGAAAADAAAAGAAAAAADADADADADAADGGSRREGA